MSLQICSNHTSLDSTNAPPCTIQDIKNELAKYTGQWRFVGIQYLTYHTEYKPTPKIKKSRRCRKIRTVDPTTRLDAPKITPKPMVAIDLETEINNLAKWLGFTLVYKKIAGRANAIQGWYLIKPGQSPQYLIYLYLGCV